MYLYIKYIQLRTSSEDTYVSPNLFFFFILSFFSFNSADDNPNLLLGSCNLAAHGVELVLLIFLLFLQSGTSTLTLDPVSLMESSSRPRRTRLPQSTLGELSVEWVMMTTPFPRKPDGLRKSSKPFCPSSW